MTMPWNIKHTWNCHGKNGPTQNLSGIWDKIVLPDLVLGQNMAARFGPTLPNVVLLHRTKCSCHIIWRTHYVLGPNLVDTLCPMIKFGCHIVIGPNLAALIHPRIKNRGTM